MGLGLVAFPTFFTLKGLKQKEDVISFEKANREQQELLNHLFQNGSRDLESFQNIKASVEKLKSGAVTPVSFYDRLFEAARRAKIGEDRYPELRRYWDYLKDYAKVDPARLLSETQALREAVFKKAL